MTVFDASGRKNLQKPYRNLRDDPRYDEIKRIIEGVPPEKIEILKRYLQSLLRNS